MVKLALALILALALAIVMGNHENEGNKNSRILFVNELCRHGARAPEFKEYHNDGFPNGNGMLTSSGIRQHYLLGKQLHKRYVKESHKDVSKLLSPDYDVDEIYIRSTQVLRTIQSAEAQMLGLYSLGSSKKLEKKLTENAKPHINVNNEKKIIKELGTDPIEDAYRPIPVHNYDLYVDDMVAYGNCPYMVNDYLKRMEDHTIWDKYDDYFRPLIYTQIAAAFNASADDLYFLSVAVLEDILWAEDFQGIQNRYNFTKEEFEIVKHIQKPNLVELLSDVSRAIMASRMINPVVEMMKSKLGMEYNQTLVSDFEKSKFLLFSSHDYQISQVLTFLNPENLDFKYVDYASVVLYELHESQSFACRMLKSEDCHFVKVFFNNDQLKLPGCKNLDCTFNEFEKYIAEIGMTYPEMTEQCAKDVTGLTQNGYDKFRSLVTRY